MTLKLMVQKESVVELAPDWMQNHPIEDECFVILNVKLPKGYKLVIKRGKYSPSYIRKERSNEDFVRVQLYAKKEGDSPQ